MTRSEFRNRYRDARRADRLAIEMITHDLPVRLTSFYPTVWACPGFASTRLTGDWLRYRSEAGDGYKLHHLRKPVGLPA